MTAAKMIRIGPYVLPNNLALAPMAGVTDLPFRLLCRRMGAGIAAGEMLTSDVRLWHTEKSRRRMDHSGEAEPRVVQIAGGDPQMMAEAAQRNVDAGAQIIDINMGCPAKKVCNKAAGSALMKDETLVRHILEAVVKAVAGPGDAEDAHGLGPRPSQRRDDCPDGGSDRHSGAGRSRPHARVHVSAATAEYETIRAIKQSVAIPIFANGDIDSPHKAKLVLEQTGADGLMVGRSAQGRPWIFREIEHFLRTSGIARRAFTRGST